MLNQDKRALVAPACALEIFSIGNVFGRLCLSEIYSVRNIFARKFSKRKKANYGTTYIITVAHTQHCEYHSSPTIVDIITITQDIV